LPVASSAGAAGGYIFVLSPLVEEEDYYNFCCVRCSPDPWLWYSGTKKPQMSLPKENPFELRQQNHQRDLAEMTRKGKKTFLARETIILCFEMNLKDLMFVSAL